MTAPTSHLANYYVEIKNPVEIDPVGSNSYESLSMVHQQDILNNLRENIVHKPIAAVDEELRTWVRRSLNLENAIAPRVQLLPQIDLFIQRYNEASSNTVGRNEVENVRYVYKDEAWECLHCFQVKDTSSAGNTEWKPRITTLINQQARTFEAEVWVFVTFQPFNSTQMT